jgi:hypothetical protein
MADYCGVAETGCVNPAGYAIGNASWNNTDPGRTRWCCPRCGAVTCRKCRRKVAGIVLCITCGNELSREGGG